MNSTEENVIVVGVDGRPASMAAVVWAATEAANRKAELRLVSAYMIPVGLAGSEGMMPPDLLGAYRDTAECRLSDAVKLAENTHPGLAITTVLTHSSAYAALVQASERALMTVVGSHGDNEIGEVVLGSVTLRMTSLGKNPVVVVRGDPAADRPTVDGPILVGLDGSVNSHEALAFAFEQASIGGKALLAIHSWDDQPSNGFLSSYRLDVDRERFETEQRVLAEQLVGWSNKYPDVPVHAHLLRGRPAASILRWCRESVDHRPALIVVGSRGHGGFTGMLLGSTSQALLAHAPCPVAVVRPNTKS